MKKVILAGILTMSASLFAEVDLNEHKTIDKIALAGLNANIAKVDKAAAGRWYLYQGETAVWKKVRNDEFELDGAIEEAYTHFLNKIKENKDIIGQTSVLRLGAQFGKYNFKKQEFPLSLMSKNSYISYYGSVLAYNGKTKLSFDNINPNNTILPMIKADAKQFMKARKNSRGSVDRDLTAKYSYVIKKIISSSENIEQCQENFRGCSDDINVKVIGHITKLEILGKDGKVLKTYDNYK
ncbi:DUF4852 domain-containing protein [Sulfurimonas sp. ST-27]|uniref:DUF4852 domain-containing protein n=1 Tax=Sulfurimonas sp. ST-27 TaxID=3400152 RepID=UPI003AB37E3E